MGKQPEKNPVEDVSWGCAFSIFGFGVLALLLVLIFSGAFSSDDYDTDDDCNDDWIEMDYNGDGEKDAEDFRIQTEGC